MAWPAYTWSETARQYRGADGRFVPRSDVRAALDDVVNAAAAEIEALAKRLQAGEIELPEWQVGMEKQIKIIHTASGAIGKGGWAQMEAKDWSLVANRVKAEYTFLRDFAIELEDGLPLDGRFILRAQMYGVAGTGTYEKILRNGDMKAGFTEERRILWSLSPCDDCVGYADLGWQPIGSLPDIGTRCQCRSNCRCSFERRRPDGRALGARMAIPGLNRRKCLRRNQVAGLAGELSIPVLKFYKDVPDPLVNLRNSRGSLPASDEEALARINTILGKTGDQRLKLDDIYIFYPEAGNTNYIGDRSAFMGRSTLRNVATAAQVGFAFMNGHRTGSMSTPSELPFGRTFAGRYEIYGDDRGSNFARALLGFYMLRGVHPNGTSGPSTDELAKGIDGGTIFDVSLGLYSGREVCDVCGNELFARDDDGYLCKHVPGTHAHMNDEDIEYQRERGVPEGVCSYTIEDAEPVEVSAVYDGAVPGAGFRKALQFAKSNSLGRIAKREALDRYGQFMSRKHVHLFAATKSRKGPAMGRKIKILDVLEKLGLDADDINEDQAIDTDDLIAAFGGRKRLETQPPAAPPAEPPPAPPAADPQVAELQRQLNETRTQLTTQQQAWSEYQQQARVAQFEAAAYAFIQQQQNDDKKATPAETPHLGQLHFVLAQDDVARPLGGDVTRIGLLSKIYEVRPPVSMFAASLASEIPANAKFILKNSTGPRDEVEPTKERVADLLNRTSAGAAAFARLGGNVVMPKFSGNGNGQ